nr:MAG TPA: Protein of unknown function (DUF1043) [Bacteriophage sp.]
MSAISIIGCVVGIVGCIIGVATFVSAMLTKSRQDGIMIAKIDQCVKGISDLREDVKEKNHELDAIIDQHTKDITQLQTEMKTVFKYINSFTKEG